MSKNKWLTVVDKWNIDVKAYKDGAIPAKIMTPQCEMCKYFIKGNALHCKKYKYKRKPDYILFCEDKCKYYEK
ncbi:hypothetical protein [Eubacterium sp.]